jgi:hypothetical protein
VRRPSRVVPACCPACSVADRRAYARKPLFRERQIQARDLLRRSLRPARRSAHWSRGLRSRLVGHASGRRSGDQFCVYVADLLVLSEPKPQDIATSSDPLGGRGSSLGGAPVDAPAGPLSTGLREGEPRSRVRNPCAHLVRARWLRDGPAPHVQAVRASRPFWRYPEALQLTACPCGLRPFRQRARQDSNL